MSDGSPPSRPSGGCWKWGGIACIGCGCAAVIAAAVMATLVVSRPEFKKVVATAREATEILVQMQKIGEALGKYVHDKGVYPDRLEDLVPAYLSEADIKPRAAEKNGRFEYRKPPRDATDTFVVLRYEMENPVAPGQAPSIRYELTKGGQLRSRSIVKPAEAPRR